MSLPKAAHGPLAWVLDTTGPFASSGMLYMCAASKALRNHCKQCKACKLNNTNDRRPGLLYVPVPCRWTKAVESNISHSVFDKHVCKACKIKSKCHSTGGTEAPVAKWPSGWALLQDWAHAYFQHAVCAPPLLAHVQKLSLHRHTASPICTTTNACSAAQSYAAQNIATNAMAWPHKSSERAYVWECKLAISAIAKNVLHTRGQ